MTRFFALFESFGTRVAETKAFRKALGMVSRLPLPFSRIPVTVFGNRVGAHTLDRFLVLWMWKFRLLGATEADLLSRLCKEGMRVVDIGANIGAFTMLLARCTGETGHVWAFEPDPGNYATLRKNLVLNRYPNVTALPCAVGSVSGTGRLYRSPFQGDHRICSSDPHRNVIPIEIISLDAFFPPGERIDLIKMDIQGAEAMALHGMERLLVSTPGIILFMEFWPKGLRETGFIPEKVLTDLMSWGFVLKEVEGKTGRMERIEHPERFVQSLAGARYTNILATPKAD